jgi:ribulose-5-phosphate 4-epimerase/fuculose-1-phosphate aldolase
VKKIHIISGGTISHVATHLALAAPAYGSTGIDLSLICDVVFEDKMEIVDHYTKMAGDPYGGLETNADVEALIDELVADPDTKIIFMPVALCDFEVVAVESVGRTGWNNKVAAAKGAKRLHSRDYRHLWLNLVPAPKIIEKVRQKRKDIFLVGFKTTDGVSEDEQYLAGLDLLKGASCNLVLANDVKTRVNMVITPEEARYHVTTNREEAIRGLVQMTKLRSHLTFTRSTVVAGEPVSWRSDLVPAALRTVVDYCIGEGAYKPFRGATVGHFAAKLSENEFLTSQRKTNFNDLDKLGLVRIKTDGPDTVLAYGAKPSVGGQSQRIVFSEHPEYDCIVHFHCPLKPCTGCHRKDWACGCNDTLGGTIIPIVSQREFECGSHQCGQNTSTGLKKFGNLSCVMLDQHGPNIVFHHSIDPAEVIAFIKANFDLSAKTGGFVSLT